jgi:hypothetical protein
VLHQHPHFPTPRFRHRLNRPDADRYCDQAPTDVWPALPLGHAFLHALRIALPLGLFLWVGLAVCAAAVIRLLA